MCHFWGGWGWGGGRGIHLAGNFPLHTKLYFKWSVSKALTFPANFPVKTFWKVTEGWALGAGLHFPWWETPERPAHTSRGTCSNERINSLKPDPRLRFYDLSRREWLGRPSQKRCPSTGPAFTEVSYWFLSLKGQWILNCDIDSYQVTSKCWLPANITVL